MATSGQVIPMRPSTILQQQNWPSRRCCRRSRPVALGLLLVTILFFRSIAPAQSSQVVAWGDNAYGQTNAPSGTSDAVALACGDYHSLALRADGSVLVWGRNDYGQTNVPGGLNGVELVARGATHNLVVRTNGALVGWGRNDYGQATAPAGLSDVIATSGGTLHSLALRRNGTVLAWGGNANGQTNVPPGLSNCVAVAAGGLHSVALRADGTVVAWGYNYSGQTNVPAGLDKVVAISAVGNHTYALREDGTVVGWGTHYDGFGEGELNVPADLTNAVTVVAGHAADLALRSDSTVRGWGNNFYVDTTVPAGLTNVFAVGAGAGHWVALRGGGAPALLARLADRSVNGGQAVYFHMPGSGAWPLRYQWRFNGTNLPAATHATLKLTNVQMAQSGFYSVSVSNDFGGVVSAEARLTVAPLTLVTPPRNQLGYFGCAVTLVAGAQGIEPVYYQWRYAGSNLPGATQARLMLTNLQLNQAGNYSLIVSNALTTVTSAPARLDVQVIAAWGDNSSGQTNVPASLTNVAALASGSSHNLALRRDGTVFGWGRGTSGETNVPAGLSQVVAMAAGGSHSMALRANGTVAVWGVGPTNLPAGLSNVIAISAGGGHDLALRRDGTVVAWGDNYYGQTNVPAGLSNVIMIASGYYYSLALKADGTVIGWGKNDYGQASGASLSNIIAIAAGVSHSVALRKDGTVIVWGDNYNNQQNIPAGLSNVVAIASTGHHTVAERADGTLVTWGYNNAGQINVPIGASNAVSVAAGLVHSTALMGHGSPFILNGLADRAVAAGGNAFFQCAANGAGPLSYQWLFNGALLPNATNALLLLTNVQPSQAGLYSLLATNAHGSITSAVAQLSVPPMIITAQPQSQVSFANGTVTLSLGLQASGAVTYQWRFNGVDLAGATNSTLVLSNLQPEQSGLYSVVASNAYGFVTSSAARLDVSFVAAWGLNTSGQTNVPPGLIAPRMVAGGSAHTLALQSDGTIVAWGRNLDNQTNVPASLSDVVAIAAGSTHSFALKSDGTVVAWGGGSFGETNVPAGLSNVIAIESGNNHGLALRADGTVAGWGYDSLGQATVPAGLSNIVGISARSSHNLAVRADGTVVAWGYNYYHQTDVPTGLSNVIAVAASGDQSYALRADGAVVVWGDVYFPGQMSLTNVMAISAGGNFGLALHEAGNVSAWGWWDTYGATTVPSGLAGVVQVAGGGNHSLALIGNGPPSLLTPLPDRTIQVTGTVFFRAAACGAGPLRYQWRRNGTDLPGATNALLTLTNAQVNQAGLYSVVVSNSLGVAASREAQLNVPPLTFAADPQTQTGFAGSTVMFSVGVNGPGPFTYQWRFNGNILPGATNATLVLSNVQPAQIGNYSVTVGNAFGAVTSGAGRLTVDLVGGWGGNQYGQATVPPGLTNVVGVAAGGEHSLVLRSDGTVGAWGYSSAATNVPSDVTDAVAIAGGDYHSLALRADGTVAVWGNNNLGQAVVPAGLSNVVAIAAGDYHNLAVRKDGSIAVWGNNSGGQLAIPASATNVVAVAGGRYHCLALRADGTVVAWGMYNNYDYGQNNVPLTLTNAIAIAAGGNHSLALRADGTVIGWGDSPYGNRNFPNWLSNAVAVADMEYYSAGLRGDGTPFAWGYYSSPTVIQAGPSNTVAIAAGHGHVLSLVGSGPPFLPASLANRSALVGGAAYFQATVTGARPMSFQWRLNGTNIVGATNSYLALNNVQPGQAGLYSLRASNSSGAVIGAEAQLTVLPLVLATQPQSQRVLAGGSVTFSVVAREFGPFTYQWRFNGTNLPGATSAFLTLSNLRVTQAGVYSVAVSNAYGSVVSAPASLEVGVVTGWGYNAGGQTNVPLGLTNVMAIAGGREHSLALRGDGLITAWGRYDLGGQSVTIVPAFVPATATNVVGISAGANHSLALRGDGTVVAWARNDSGQTNVPSNVSQVAAVSAGYAHSLALRSDGTVVGWGDNWYGQSSVPQNLANVIRIASGGQHSLALQADGSVVAWGMNNYGQSTIPVGLSNVIAVAGGYQHNLALLADGTVVAWGNNIYGQTSVPAGLSNVVAVAAGSQFSLALRSDGQVIAWGYNSQGQTSQATNLMNGVALAGGDLHGLALVAGGAPQLPDPLLDRVAVAGRPVFFHSPAVGARSMAYQWRFNGAELPGETNALLTLASPQFNQAGLYSLVVSNAEGVAMSREAQLTVLPVQISTPPLSQTSYVGLTTTFSVGVLGSGPLAYQWRFNGVDLPGATDASLVLNNLQLDQAGLYSVVISNSYGSLTSSVVVLEMKTIVGWGGNDYGQTNAPSGLIDAVALAGGDRHSLALRADGTVSAWGENSFVPPGLANVRAIAAANRDSFAIGADGSVTAWGPSVLVDLPNGLTNAVALSCGGIHALALGANGRVFAWGDNSYSQVSVPADLTNVVAVAAGGTHSLALRGDGTLAAWGNNSLGQLNVPAGLSNVVAICAGNHHNVALRADGSVLAWGYNYFYSTNVPADATNVVAIASGQRHNLALRADSAVLGWGLYDCGGGYNCAMETPPWLTNVASVAAGRTHSLSLAANGPPFVFSGLADRIVPVGGRVYFHATASGKRTLSYQWRFNGADVPGATNQTLLFTNAQLALDGLYSVAVSNAAGVALSQAAKLTVVPLIVTAHPTSRTVNAGLNTTFTVGVMGEGPFSYQWRFYGTNLPGATNAALTLTNLPLNQAGFYSVTVSNAWGAATSAEAQLFVTPFSISSLTPNQTTNAGCTPTFTVAPSGTGPFSYQWRFNGADLAGATSSTLRLFNVQPEQAGVYSAVVMNAYGTLTNSPATLRVTPVVEWGYLYPNLPVVPTNLANVVAIGIGFEHSLGLRRDGTVAAWGSNLYGQTNLPSGLTNIAGISAGGYFNLAVRSNGTVAAWGRNDYGQINLPQGLSNVMAVAAGGYHALALRANGTVAGWGRNDWAQGNIPAGLSNVVAVAGGGLHSLALRGDGTVLGWGNNTSGQLNVPANLTNAVAIAAGDTHSVALKSDGRVVAWGSNSNGQTNVPVTLSNVVAVGAGLSFSAALRRDGTVVSWGASFNGITNVPAGLTNLAAIAATANRTLGLGGAGAPTLMHPLLTRRASGFGRAYFQAVAAGARPLSYQWRLNGMPLSGATNELLSLTNLTPSQTGFYSVSVSNAFGAILSPPAWLEVGDVAAWGGYFNGSSNGPIAGPLGVTNVAAIAAGDDHGVALRADGTIVAWGNNQYNQTVVSPGQGATFAIAAGGNHSLALRSNGTVVAWGRNNVGQIAVPAGLSNVVVVAAGREHSLALRDDGRVLAWGSPTQGQTNVPAGLSGVVAIAGGGTHSLALRADGTVAAWGSGAQTNVPSGLANVVAIAAGFQHSLGLRGDGKVFAWGSGPQTNVPGSLSNVVAIAAGEQHSLALRADGTVIAWGANTIGQTNVPASLSNVIALAAGADFGLARIGFGQPVITVQPFSSQSAPGGFTTLRIMAVGNGPLSYQWQRDGVNLAGATNSVLNLNGDAITARYRVIVSNPLGSTASRDAAVTSLPMFDLSGTARAANGFRVRLIGLSGRNHVILFASTNLSNWQPVHTNAPVFGALNYVDRAATNLPLRFYRAVETDLGLGPLRLQGAVVGPSRQFQLTVRGLSGAGPLVLMTSTNLVNWQPLITNPPVIGDWQFTHQPVTNSPARFYRAEERR